MGHPGSTDHAWHSGARRRRWVPVAAFAAVGVLAVVSVAWELWAHLRFGGRTHGQEALQIVSGGAVFAAALALAVRRPQNRTWALVLWLCACGFVQDLGPPNRALLTAEMVFGQLAQPAFVHLVLAYPFGALRTRLARVVVAVGYVIGLGAGLLDAVVTTSSPGGRRYVSYLHVTAIARGATWMTPVGDLLDGARLATAVAGLALLLLAARRAHALARPLRMPLYVVAVVSTGAYLALLMQQVGADWSATTELLIYLVLQALVPVALVLGLLGERQGKAVVADLVVALEHAPIERLAAVLGRALRDPGLAGYLHALAARLAFAGGDDDDGRRHLVAARSSAFDLGDGSTLWRADAAEGFGALGRGEPAIAAGLLERLTARARPAPVSVRLWDADLVEALVAVGDLAGARRWTAQLGATTTWDIAAAERCRALVDGDARVALAHAVASVDRFEAAGAPFERARSELVAAELADRVGRPAEADAHRSRGSSTFAALGAREWVGRATAGTASGDTAPGDDAWGDALTTQERAVALVIAAGASNQDAAARLYLSTKTVEMYLTRVYRKLGVRSRTQLALLVRGAT